MDGTNATHERSEAVASRSEHITKDDLADAVRASAMLVTMNISTWSGEKTDRNVTRKVKNENNVKGKGGKWVKTLLSGVEEPLEVCRSAFNAVRTRHYQLCPPWTGGNAKDGHRGPRLLSSALSMTYMKEIGALKRVAEEQRDVFCERYQELVTQAQLNLGDTADERDYPDVADIRKKFDIQIQFDPIPAGVNFPSLPDPIFKALSKSIGQRQKAAAEAAQAHVWARVRSEVSHLRDLLSDPERGFKAGSLNNVKSLGELLPGLNMFDDDRMDEIAKDIIDGLNQVDVRLPAEVGQFLGAVVDAKRLRDDPDARQRVCQRMTAIVIKLDEMGV